LKVKKKNKIKFWLIIVAAVIVSSVFIGFIFRRPIMYYAKLVYHKTISQEPKLRTDFKETNFDKIFIPQASVFGIDVSRHQGHIDWDLLSDFRFKYHKIDFVFIKATESVKWHDKQFKSNWKQAKKHSIVRGAYHFFDPREDAATQMHNFFKRVKIEEGDLPPMLDVEQESRISTSEYRRKVLECLKLMEQHYELKPILYVNNNFYESYFSTAAFKSYPLWISQLTNTAPEQDDWILWQFSHTGIIPGINEYVDVNAFNGSKEDFNILIKN
jgi:lysozyme